MLVLEGAAHLPTAFSAGFPGGIQLLQSPDPRNVRGAMAAPDADGWKDAMDRVMQNLKSHEVYELVPHTSGMRTLTLGWVIHRKLRDGVIEKNKGRLVARGNHQRPGIDYGGSFLPVMHLLALAATRDQDVIQFDITSAYLHGMLKDAVFMDQPEGYVAQGKENWVWKLKKALYGLVQARTIWNEEPNAHMVGEGFVATPKGPSIY